MCDLMVRAKAPNRLCSKGVNVAKTDPAAASTRARARGALVCAVLEARFNSQKMPPDAAAVNEKKWPCPGDYFAKKCIVFFAKNAIFCTFCFSFSAFGVSFLGPKMAQYKGISEIQFRPELARKR